MRCNKNAFPSNFCRLPSISNKFFFPRESAPASSCTEGLGLAPFRRKSQIDVVTSLVEEVLAQLEPLDVKVALGRDVGEFHGQPDVELLLELL